MTFTVQGLRAGQPANIVWADGAFEDPLGPCHVLIEAGAQVCATATGPCYPAAAKPATVALLTAVAAMDAVTRIDGADDVLEELRALSAIPEGAVS